MIGFLAHSLSTNLIHSKNEKTAPTKKNVPRRFTFTVFAIPAHSRFYRVTKFSIVVFAS
jgi:hypothetical protein